MGTSKGQNYVFKICGKIRVETSYESLQRPLKWRLIVVTQCQCASVVCV